MDQKAERQVDYRGLLDAAPDAMVVADKKGTIVLANERAEKSFGYGRDGLAGQPLTMIIPDGLHGQPAANGSGIEQTAQRRDGSAFPIEITTNPMRGADGERVTVAIRDISGRKKTEAELLKKIAELTRSNEELGHFAYIASHDLQEPLRMVASYTQLLARRYKGKLDSEADEFIAFAVDGASRMQRLIQDLLSYSRIDTGGHELHAISSEEALRQALTNLQGAVEESHAEVTHDPLPPVMADEGQLIQLFQNLLSNAIKYKKPGVPRVHVAATRNGSNQWTFSVQDNGLGIEPQNFERIFGMFQRLHKRDEFSGTGIGLAICKKIVERHGGHISVESQPGVGSTFRFALAGGER